MDREREEKRGKEREKESYLYIGRFGLIVVPGANMFAFAAL
jgi:hypothetical protein